MKAPLLPLVASFAALAVSNAFSTCSTIQRGWRPQKVPPSAITTNRLSILGTRQSTSLIHVRWETPVSADPADEKQDDNEISSSSSTIWRSLLYSIARGITIPFPALRKVTLNSNRSNQVLSIGLSPRQGLAAIMSYFLLGVLAYHKIVEQWPIVDALYFTCVTFSTVGFGDVTPTSALSQGFTTCFGLGGIAFLGAAIATIGSTVVNAEREAVAVAKKKSRDKLLRLFCDMPHVLGKFRQKSTAQQLKVVRHAEAKTPDQDCPKTAASGPKKWYQTVRRLLLPAIPSLSLILTGGLVMRFLEGNTWSLIETLYFSLVTASTIGFGDLAPTSARGRLFAVVFIPLAVAAAGEIFSTIALSFVQQRQKKIFAAELSSDLSMAHLKAMDADGDGQITREEYVAFMLLEMGRVDRAELEELQGQFKRLDVTESGYLDREDLKLMAQLRGRRVVE
jgi:hypothetical protein